LLVGYEMQSPKAAEQREMKASTKERREGQCERTTWRTDIAKVVRHAVGGGDNLKKRQR
jgi:hypothetical protein